MSIIDPNSQQIDSNNNQQMVKDDKIEKIVQNNIEIDQPEIKKHKFSVIKNNNNLLNDFAERLEVSPQKVMALKKN